MDKKWLIAAAMAIAAISSGALAGSLPPPYGSPEAKQLKQERLDAIKPLTWPNGREYYWYVAEHNGSCHMLPAMFEGMNTPEELHERLTSGGARLTLERIGSSGAMIYDAAMRFMPLVMIAGLDGCRNYQQAR